jgi:hypothetical protein
LGRGFAHAAEDAKALFDRHLGGTPADAGGNTRDHDAFHVLLRKYRFWCISGLLAGRGVIGSKLSRAMIGPVTAFFKSPSSPPCHPTARLYPENP